MTTRSFILFRDAAFPPAHRLGYAAALAALAALFACRVAGQAIQLWIPQAALPPFEAFQGSGLPYSLLLPAQIAILALMLHLAWRVALGRLQPRPRLSRLLAGFGWVYFASMLARLVIGRVFDTGSPWLEAWIPALFHLVLAAFVLTLSRFHRYAGLR